MPKVTFEPYQATADAFPAETILEIAMRLGIHINASCGGLGACGKCKVILEKGDVQGAVSYTHLTLPTNREV